MEELARALNQYIKENHTQEECIGFIDGFKKAIELENKKHKPIPPPNQYENSTDPETLDNTLGIINY